MNKVIFPSKIKGNLNAPASKSFMQRAIALAVVNEGNTKILNPTYCDDALAGLEIARNFGFNVSQDKDFVSLERVSEKIPDQLMCGESGLAIRLFAPIVALANKEVELQAEGSLLKRPADFMEQTFKQLGVGLQTNNGFPPIKINGPIKENTAEVDGSISSQFLSGLLIALPKASHDTKLNVSKLMSIPYIDMTLAAIESFGGKIEYNADYSEFTIEGNQKYNTDEYFIEGDWSGAAGLLVAGAIAGEITVERLSTSSTQADMAVLNAIEQTGAIISKTADTVTIKAPNKLKAFNFDALHCPDLFPVLTALAANCDGVSRINGVHRLTHKESNRALALKQEFNKIGLRIDFEDDEMVIYGGKMKGAEVFAHNDHRIAMAMTLAAFNADGNITITGAECVNKTYPAFYTDMVDLGAKIQ